MNTFSDDLRQVRVIRNISLAEISRQTRIPVKYLEAIEEGNFDILPQTYVRAFLQEYAAMIGLTPSEVLAKYDIMVTGRYAESSQVVSGSGWSSSPLSSTHRSQPVPSTTSKTEEPARPTKHQRLIITLIVITIVATVTLLIIDYAGQDVIIPVSRETPFQDVIADQETTLFRDSVLSATPAIPSPQQIDSLLLQAAIKETVWLNIQIDTAKGRSYLIPPSRRSWKAENRIALTLGNAGTIEFTLNGIPMGTLGKRGEILRNYIITEATVQRLKEE